MRSLVLSNARARGAKLVLSSKPLTKYRALSDLLRSLIVSRVPRQMLSIAQPAHCAKSYTVAKQEDDQATNSENTYARLRKMTKTHRGQSRGILISLTILKNTCLFAAFPYIREPQTAEKNLEQRFIFQIGTLNLHGINERFSFN